MSSKVKIIVEFVLSTSYNCSRFVNSLSIIV